MSDTVLVAIISGAVSLLINFGSKWLDKKNGIAKDIDTLAKGIKEIQSDVNTLKENDKKSGDMIYTMLSHMASGNETGEMRRALNDYNAYFRHN